MNDTGLTQDKKWNTKTVFGKYDPQTAGSELLFVFLPCSVAEEADCP